MVNDPLAGILDMPAPQSAEATPAAVVPAARRARSVRAGQAEAETLAGPVSLLSLEVSGFKRLRAVRLAVAPEGLTVIGGNNGAGKTSILDAVQALFGGRAIPEVPVREGEHHATLVAEFGPYRAERIIRPDRSSSIEITRADGSPVPRPVEFLSSLTGVLWFDPLEFLRQDRRAQAETLRRLLGLDWSDLDNRRQSLYDVRRDIGRDRDRAKGHAESLPFHADAPPEPVSASDLAAELAAANAQNQAIAESRSKLARGETWVQAARDECNRLAAVRERTEAEIADLVRRLEDAKTRLLGVAADVRKADDELAARVSKLSEARTAYGSLEEIDTAPILARMGEIETINRRVRENQARVEAFRDAEALAEQYEGITGQIAEIDAEKRRQLADADMPVEGLGFDDEGLAVQFGGLPLEQASGAEQMRVAVAVAMRMSGNLRIALVDEGEKLDLEQLRAMDETVRQLGGQVLMTRVSVGDEVSLVIEDGMVVPA